ncbi:MAG: hypothetical protein ACRDS9_11550 [Pseudonocardiaceae bacterium]
MPADTKRVYDGSTSLFSVLSRHIREAFDALIKLAEVSRLGYLSAEELLALVSHVGVIRRGSGQLLCG